MALSYDLERALQSELKDGERLLWQGQPDPARTAMVALPVVLFGIPFTAFAVFWIVTASGITTAHHFSAGTSPSTNPIANAFTFFPLFGIPFVLVGVGMLLAPLWAWRAASQTAYAVTDKRAIIMTGKSRRTVQSFFRQSLDQLERIEKPDGTGDLIFTRQITNQSTTNGTRPVTRLIGFLGIPNPREVENIIQENVVRSE